MQTRKLTPVSVVFGAVAALITGLITDAVIQDFEHSRDAGGEWSQAVFILLVPAAFGSVTLFVARREVGWQPFLLVAAVSAAAMAYAAGRQYVNGLDENQALKFAGRAWYGVMYFGGGMLVPLAVALRQACLERPERPNPPV